MRAVCIREVQKTLAQSSKRQIEQKIAALSVGSDFKIHEDKIITPGNGLIIFQGMQDHTAESIKSLEGFKIAWIEEAQSLSQRSLTLLRPTIRAEGSEIWASWNPRRKTDAIDEFLRQKKPEGSVVVEANWRDNPWFPQELEAERQLDLKLYPERYAHIWEGDYARAFDGAYFARGLSEARARGARRQGRGRSVAAAARVLRSRRLGRVGRRDGDLDRAVGRPGNPRARLHRGRRPGARALYRASCARAAIATRCACCRMTASTRTVSPASVMPIICATPASSSRWSRTRAGAQPRCGSRRCDGSCHAAGSTRRPPKPVATRSATTTSAATRQRNIGLGPEHDWSSHAADSFGLMAIAYEEPARNTNFNRRIEYSRLGWM